ncbi:outer membrane beta-barrel protein [Lewinella sp. W8]|uniref:outer membrane beta-barrel protein n=1 Tax=Lewinella sp. W8 TaxID=2528208 RepID=UPI0010671ED8|nr:outer membrane beta-barrel protein [Lewinella sp. W8]MTB52538.1 outer membrane beta-barrel protein [Lewinella sp. W8]
MPNLEDHNMDKMFQVGAERHDFSYNPEAWEQMTILLDEDKKRRRRALWWWLGLGMLLLLGGLSYLMLQQPVAGAKQAADATVTEHSDERAGSEIPAPKVTEPAGPSVERDEIQMETPQLSPVVSQENSSSTPNSLPTPTGSLSQKTDRNLIAETPLGGAEEPAGAPVPPTEALRAESIAQEEISQAPLAAIGPLSPMPTVTLMVETTIPERSVHPQTLPDPDAKEKVASGFAAGIGGGLVFGAVADDGFAMAQPRYGGKVEYRLHDKWAFGTGAYLNDVCYQTTTENYTAKAGFWTDGILPSTITGQCRVLEVPLLATYYFRGSRASGPYVSGGLTTYFMLREDYDFTYDFEYPNVIKSWREENEYQHFLGMGQFSIGYQQAMKRKSAFQLESFVQLPLTGIGHGEVRLMTIGASLSYTFDFRKR